MTPAVLHILLSLAAEDRHGLGIAADVKAFSQGRLSLGPGTLYGTIKRLLEGGLVEDLGSPSADDTSTPLGAGPGDPRRRYYRITPKGRRALERETDGLATVLGVAKRRLKTS
jgi:DNA-binding PadR family transcriptional regulator